MKKALMMMAAGMLAATPAIADTVKVGYMTTLSGGAGIIGKQMQNAVNLAMEHTGGKLGGMDAEVIFADDQRKPDVAKQLANRLVKSDKVDVVAGVIWSNLLMAIHKPVTRSGTLLISSNAGHHRLQVPVVTRISSRCPGRMTRHPKVWASIFRIVVLRPSI